MVCDQFVEDILVYIEGGERGEEWKEEKENIKLRLFFHSVCSSALYDQLI